MSNAKTYLLPCECSARIPVGTGQAGGTVTCPQCRSVRKVPRLGDLGRLELAPEAPRPPARRWTMLHAITAAGVVTAVVSFAAAWGIDAFNGVSTRSFLNPDVIRESMNAADAADAYRGWQAFSRGGTRRPPQAVEVKLERMERATGRIADVFRGLALLGLAIAAGGGAGLFATGRGAGGTGR